MFRISTFLNVLFFLCCSAVLAQPGNDNCADAIDLSVNAVCSPQSFTSIGSSGEPTSIAENPSCGFYQNADVWFTFTVPSSGDFRIELSGQNPSWTLNSGTCGDFTEIHCDGIGENFSNPDWAGETFYIRVYRFNSANGGNFDICITEIDIPENDLCANAINLEVGATCIEQSFSSVHSLGESIDVADDPSCGFFQNGDVWFTFTVPSSGDFRIELSGQNPSWTLNSGTCGDFTEIHCDGSAENFSNPDWAGETFYIRVYRFNNENGGDFDICVTEIDIPENDLCANAINLEVGATCIEQSFSSVHSLRESIDVADDPSCGFFQNGDVWFTFTVPSSGDFRIELSGQNPSWTLNSGTCGDFTEIHCDGSAENFSNPDWAGDTFYIRVYRFNNENGGDFDICVTEIDIPENDLCANAINLEVGATCIQQSFSSVHSLREPIDVADDPSCGFFQNGDVWFTFTVPSSGDFRIDVSGQNPSWTLNSGTCGDFTEIHCDGSSQNFSNPDWAGETFYIRVYRFNNEEGGNFDICVSEIDVPDNDLCSNAQEIILNDECLVISASSRFSTEEPADVAGATGCGFFQGGDVWFKFTAPETGQFSLERLSNSNGSNANFAFYTGSCGDFSQYDCSGSSELNFNDPQLGGQEIFVRVFSFNNENGSDFEFCITNTSVAENDNCENATLLPVNQTCEFETYNNFNTTAQVDIAPSPSCGFFQGGDVWFQFEVPESGQMQINKVDISGGSYAFSLYTGSCGDFNEFVCVNGESQYLLSAPALIGETLYLRLYRFNSAFGGEFDLCLVAGDCNADLGGSAFIDECGTCVGGNTGLEACVEDCNGVFGGSAFLDNCDTCVGGNTGLAACVEDCNGDFGGTAFTDECDICVGGDTGLEACVEDCNGDFGGTAFIDECETCVDGNTGLEACIEDCNGDFGGTAFFDNCDTCVGGNTGIEACEADCNGDFGGTAFFDNCDTCVGGTTGLTACIEDCNGDFGGTAFFDNCDTCVGGNTGIEACEADCNGDFGGTAFFDNCDTCVGGNTGIEACEADCNGDFGGTAFFDNCDTCVGGNTGIEACEADCTGDFGGTAFFDNCDTCVGGTTGIEACEADCNGDFGGTAFFDNCDTCVGGNTGNEACEADCNGDFGGTAFFDNCDTCVGGNTGNEACVADCNGDFGGTAFFDNCDTCVGGNTGIEACEADCNGDFGGTAFFDNCDTCVGGNTGIAPCAQDCNGDFGGTAVIDNCDTCVGGNTGIEACEADCNGDFGGTAFFDNCDTCVGGNTGNEACEADCNGDFGGTAFFDNCDTCVGGNTGIEACEADCNGDFGGTAFFDNCDTCVGGNTGNEACEADCNGDFGGTAFFDNCDTCVGGNTGIEACEADCNGDFGGTAFFDNCDTCVGGNTGIEACEADCNGDFGGTAFFDNCDTCVGGNTGIEACEADCNGDFGGTAFFDNCDTCVGGNTGIEACVEDCNGDFGGTAFFDNCDTCVGGNTGIEACEVDCNGDFGGTAFFDNCDTCVGGNTGIEACEADCNGDFGGTAFFDNCDTCVGGNTGNEACVADCNGDFGGTAFFDNCDTCVGGNTGNEACVADCNGDFGGTAFFDNCDTCVGGNTGIEACEADCNGDFGGSAFFDNCDTCVGGNTGIEACEADCNGDFGGTAFFDNCDTCVGGNTGIEACEADCNGDFGGTAFFDNCDTCVGGNTGIEACEADCNGDFGGTAFFDNCDTCVGGNTGIEACEADCNGDFGGTAFFDNCDTCVGGNTGIEACEADCNGDFGGTAFFDNCDTCVGGNTGIEACEADCNGDFGGTATIDLCGVCDSDPTNDNTTCLDCEGVINGDAIEDALGVCNGDCEADANQNGICDDEEPIDGIECEDWVVYQSNTSGGITDIYEVSFDGSDASLDLIATINTAVHIAYNEANNLIYAVSTADGSYRTLNPHIANPAFSAPEMIDADVSKIIAVAFNDDGELIIGDEILNEIYAVDLSDNSVSLIDGHAPLRGGDIAYDQQGIPYLATRAQGGSLFVIVDDEVGPDVLIGNLPNRVTGMALAGTNQLLVSHANASTLRVRNLNGSNAGFFNLQLNGEDFVSASGDMASGCNTFEDEELVGCQYKLYYTHSGPGAQDGLYELILGQNGAASATFLTSAGGRQIALSPDGSLLYMLGGSNIQTYEVATNTIIQNNSVFNGENGNNLSGFPTAVADSDGNVFIAGAGSNVWQVDPATGEASIFAPNIPVNGGDLIFAPTGDEGEEELWIITRNNNTFRKVSSPEVSFTVEVPQMNGAAVLENGNVLVANGDGDGIDAYIELSLIDGSILNSYDVNLPVFNGDLAGGCTGTEIDICEEEVGECYAISADYVQGLTLNNNPLAPSRTIVNNALGAPERTDQLIFTGLGYGGSLTFYFGGIVPNNAGDDIEVVETSFNTPGCEAYKEYGIVSVSVDGETWYVIEDSICKSRPFADISNAIDDQGNPVLLDCVKYVRVANNDSASESPDGFDLDGIVALHNCSALAARPEGSGGEVETTKATHNWLSSYPNPTRGISQAVFKTGATTRTTLEVYDMNGRSVAMLYNQVANEGQEYRLEFDGSELPNGVYIYRLTTENETIIEKLMITK